MDAFILERLYPTGWRRTGDLYWQYSEAQQAANFAVKDDLARAARVLPVRVGADAVFSIEAPCSHKACGDE